MKRQVLSIPGSLRVVGIAGVLLGLLTVILPTLAYIPGHPDFSILNTYLSDIGDTPGWPQTLFNSGTLIASSVRILLWVLLVLRFSELGTGRTFARTVLIVGTLSTLGTVLMTAVPFGVSPTIHKLGIPLYFFGIVIVQMVIGLRECTLKAVPRLLPVMSFALAGAYGVFFALMVLYELDVVGRNTPVVWQWLGFSLSIAWLLAHTLVLGKEPMSTVT
jgi:hypothetical membrane protein